MSCIPQHNEGPPGYSPGGPSRYFVRQKSAFYSGHSTELQAYSSAAKNLEKEGIDQSVDLDKAIGFTEQLERKIEETKEQLRETNSEEKKAQQERKKVLDIQENHTIT